ncbi:Major facilitator superfamily transporter [Lasiodiplodia theobromae]|uniref:Major facilitator superfamily transporter n=1 Tax=Lasiodiplodia theobromae TaxID=45133 RepID=UPI0015C3CF1A|nr:Major facilitator superfamily transporter [Lasiodiplodia theobromae]KAF4540727.1 Major facilitator superfamily transporter [Lasiodiplodia theobromae]
MRFFSRPAVLAAKEPRSPAERDLVRRLDIFLMTFGCISQIIKYLDQMNINNAYVSGMKEDLELYGNELNYFQTYFNVAYCIMLIPSQVIMTYVRPSLWLSSLEIAWGVMTGLMAMVTKTYQVYIIRVFLGLFESSAWPGMMTLLMHWYTPMELAKRMGFYHSCQAVGSMMSGALQAAIMDTLHGHHGLTGWRWLFVINAVITGVWGFLGFFLLPDYPNNPNPRAFWFRKTHGEMAMTRLTRHKRAEPEKLSWAGAKRTFNSWIVYFIATLYVATVLTTNGNSFFSLFLKAMKNPDGSARWTTVQVNAIPIGGSAINVVFVWIWAILSDVFQTRWILIIAQAVLGMIPAVMLTIWTSHPDSAPLTSAYTGYFISYMSMGTAPLIFSWLSDLLPRDPSGRALIVGVSVASYYAISAWSQVLVWPASEAPYYKKGWQLSIGLWILVIAMTSTLRFIDIRYLKPKREAHAETIEGQAVEEEVNVERQSIKTKGVDVGV